MNPVHLPSAGTSLPNIPERQDPIQTVFAELRSHFSTLFSYHTTLQGGVDVNAQDQDGLTPLIMAESARHFSVVEYLKSLSR